MAEVKKVRAYAKGVDQAPRKVAIVADLVRGRSVEDALVILDHTPRRSARPVKKLIESARANALNNHNFEMDGLMIETISVTIGKRMKRYMPASRGRALPYQKKSSNILVELSGKPKAKPAKKKPVAKTKVTQAKAAPKAKTTAKEKK